MGKTNIGRASTNTPEFSLSVSRALRILSRFSAEQPELALSEISRSLSLSKASVSRFLSALEMHGYVDRDPQTKRYRAGAEAARVGSLFMDGGRLTQLALPVLETLAGRLGFTSYLSALRDDRMLILAAVEGRGPIKYTIPIGAKLPVHSTATGHAALACLSPDAVTSILKHAGLQARTNDTITSRPALLRRLRQVRARGFSINWEENTIGVGSVASAVRNANGSPVCILSVGFATSQVTRSELAGLGRQIKVAAAQLSGTLNAKGICNGS